MGNVELTYVGIPLGSLHRRDLWVRQAPPILCLRL